MFTCLTNARLQFLMTLWGPPRIEVVYFALDTLLLSLVTPAVPSIAFKSAHEVYVGGYERPASAYWFH